MKFSQSHCNRIFCIYLCCFGILFCGLNICFCINYLYFGSDILFPNARGGRLSADGVEYMVDKYLAIARQKCPSLQQKHVTPHVLRHSAAMELRASGVDLSTIALWLGHESVETTQIYLDADLALKQKALAKTRPINGKAGRYKPSDRLLSFLKSM